MSRRLIQNFRGQRAVVIQTADDNRRVLLDTLGRLGLQVSALEPPADTGGQVLSETDVVVFDVDSGDGVSWPWLPGEPGSPLIVVLGVEAPSRLQRAFELAPTAVLHKPLRATAIYSALFFAVNEHRRRVDRAEELRALRARQGARRVVIKAILLLMQREGFDDEQAYRCLRKESMRQRITIEQFAGQLLARHAPPDRAWGS